MRWNWRLVAASVAIVVAGAGAARADSETEWDETERRPPVDRPSEYRTHTVDTMSLGPVFAGFLPDGGLKLEPSPLWGLRFTLEPAEVIEIYFEGLTSFPFSEFSDFGSRETPGGSFTDAQNNTFTFERDNIEGKIFRLAAGWALVNPELQTRGGGVRLVPGLQFGAYHLRDYEGDIPVLNVQSGTSVDVPVEFDDAWIAFVAPWLRLEFMPSRRFYFGLEFRATLPVYIVSDEDVGHSAAEEFILGERVIWEPALYFSFRF